MPYVFSFDEFIAKPDDTINKLEIIFKSKFSGKLTLEQKINEGVNSKQAKKLIFYQKLKNNFNKYFITRQIVRIMSCYKIWPNFRDITSKNKNARTLDFPVHWQEKNQKHFDKDWQFIQDFIISQRL